MDESCFTLGSEILDSPDYASGQGGRSIHESTGDGRRR